MHPFLFILLHFSVGLIAIKLVNGNKRKRKTEVGDLCYIIYLLF